MSFSTILNLSGILGCLLFIFIFSYLTKKNHIDLRKHQISNLSSKSKTANAFRLLYGLSIVLEAIFIFGLIQQLRLHGTLTEKLFLLAIVTGISSSVFTKPKHTKLHASLIACMLIFSSFSLLAFALQIFKINSVLSVLSVLIFLGIAIVLLPGFFKKKTIVGIQEFGFVGLFLIWATANLLLLH